MKYLVFFLFLIMVGCSAPSGGTSSDSANSARGEAAKELKSQPDTARSVETARANNRFAFHLYKQLSSEGDNLFFSPYSISSALAMTYAGAQGNTREEMSEVFGFYKDNITHARGYQALQNHIDSLSQEELELNVANGLWCQQDYKFLQEFLNINQEYFSAVVRQVNFKKNYQQVRKQINQWVEKKTNEKIQDLIDEGVLDRMTRLVLVNAIYFNGKWAHPFDQENTQSDDFYTTPEHTQEVPFMNQSLQLPYYEEKLFKAVELPYTQGKLSMLILLPQKHEYLTRIEDELSGACYESLTDSMREQQVDLSIPRFKLRAKYQLNDPLRKMGMESAFAGNADFSGMTGSKDLYISDIVHQSYVEVDEKGTEAAAATGVVMRKTSIVEKKHFKADHPFLFIIKDQESQVILFIGKMHHPR